MIYENLILQSKIWNKLNNYYMKEKLPNALLFHGNEGSGKEGHAIEFAALINCLSPKENKSCGNCNSCKKMKILQHGNLKLIHPLPRNSKNSTSSSPLEYLAKSELELYQNMLSLKSDNPYYKIKLPKSNSILINSIRNLKKELSLSSIEKGWNIVLILEAEKLCYPNNVGANSLLKMLEEPPEKTLFILITSNYSKIINTIRSRCQNIFFPRIHSQKLYSFMKKELSENDKNIIINIADGNLNIVRDLESSIDNIYSDLKLFINSCYSSNYKYNDKIIQRISQLKRNDPAKLLIFFRIIMIYFKDLFVFSKSNDIKYIVYKDLDKHYSKITNHHPDTDWNFCITIVENTLNNIHRNASIPLSINGCLIEIRETIIEYRKEIFSINEWLNIE